MREAKLKRSNFWRNGTPAKLMERLIWLEPVLEGIPVAFRARSEVIHPIVKIYPFKVTVLLPMELARFIPTLAKLIRAWRKQRKRRGKRPERNGKPKRLCDLSQFAQPDPISLCETNNGFNGSPKQPTTLPPTKERQSNKRQQKQAINPPSQDKPKNHDAPKSPSLLSLTCRCGRTVEVPPEWLSKGVVRCARCGQFL